MRVHTAVLEAPEETHNPSKGIPFFDEDVSKCHTSHDGNNGDIDKGGELTAYSIDEKSDEECAEDFTKTEQDHR